MVYCKTHKKLNPIRLHFTTNNGITLPLSLSLPPCRCINKNNNHPICHSLSRFFPLLSFFRSTTAKPTESTRATSTTTITGTYHGNAVHRTYPRLSAVRERYVRLAEWHVGLPGGPDSAGRRPRQLRQPGRAGVCLHHVQVGPLSPCVASKTVHLFTAKQPIRTRDGLILTLFFHKLWNVCIWKGKSVWNAN